MHWAVLLACCFALASCAILLVALAGRTVAAIPNAKVRKWLVIVCALTSGVFVAACALMISFDKLWLESRLRYARDLLEDCEWIPIMAYSLMGTFAVTFVGAGVLGFFPARESPYQPLASRWRLRPLLKSLAIGLAATVAFAAVHDAFVQWTVNGFSQESAETQRALTPPAIPGSENAALVYQRVLDTVGRESDEDSRAASKLYETNPQEYYASLEPLAEIMKEAARLKRCRFSDEQQPIHILDGTDTNYALTSAAQRLTSLARHRFSEGDIDEAIELLGAVRNMENHILSDPRNREPLLFQWYESWIRLAMETASLQPNVSCDQIKRLSAPDLPVEELYLEGIHWHRAALQSHLSDVYTGSFFQRPEFEEHEALRSSSPQAFVARWLTVRTLRFLHAPDDIASFKIAFAPERIAYTDEFDHAAWDTSAHGKFLGPASSIAYTRQRALTAGSQRKLVNIAVASMCFREDHSQWPRSVDELVPKYLPAAPVDDLTDSPFRTLNIEGGVIFYSAEREKFFNRFDDSNTWWEELQDHGLACLRLGTAAEKGRE